MEAPEFFQALQDMIAECGHEYGITSARTFEDAGLLCGNLGLVVKDQDGNRHQVELPGTYGRGV